MPGLATFLPDEREQLLAYLAQQRSVLRIAAHGLSDAQARLAPTTSSLSVGGLIKHVNDVERFWIGIVQGQQSSGGGTVDYQSGFRLGPDETLDGVLERYRETAAATEAVVRRMATDDPVAVPKEVPWFPKDVEHWNLRYVLLHLVEETARHAGHADIVRESIDGATAFPLMAAVESWEPTPWITPWEAPAGTVGRPAAEVCFGSISLDCAEPKELAGFYADLLSLSITYESPEFAAIGLGGSWLSFQRVADYRPPTWPEGTVPQQAHLDFSVADLEAAEHRALVAGAKEAAIQPSPERWRVLIDPAGHPFCLSTLIPA